MNTNLTEKEKLFCELFVNGNAPYAGNAAKCYAEAFGDNSLTSKHSAKSLLIREDIQQYIEELEGMQDYDAKNMKKFLTASLIRIVEEASTAEYQDRRGTKLSPAPLRSVAVSASKALMEMYPVKEAQVSKLNIEGGEGGVTFNVIVPNAKPTPNTEE